MTRAISIIVKVIEFVLAGLLLGMVIMVATNVVLRYGFNSGLNFSEEMSRYFFVWLTFIGAVLAFKDHGHIGVETIVRLFGRRGRVASECSTLRKKKTKNFQFTPVACDSFSTFISHKVS